MPSGASEQLDGLPSAVARILDEARRGVLATVDPAGKPHAVPVGYAIVGGRIAVEVDDTKPKSARELARVRNIRRNPDVALLVDRWDEDWTRLGWVMVRGRARIAPPGTARAALRTRYPQYADDPLEGPVIVIEPERVLWWTWTAP